MAEVQVPIATRRWRPATATTWSIQLPARIDEAAMRLGAGTASSTGRYVAVGLQPGRTVRTPRSSSASRRW